jgi:hypothetical protein
MEEAQIKERAYFLYLEGIGKDDTERYYMARKIHIRLERENQTNVYKDSRGAYKRCFSCDKRKGTVILKYLRCEGVCPKCYHDNSVKSLMNKLKTGVGDHFVDDRCKYLGFKIYIKCLMCNSAESDIKLSHMHCDRHICMGCFYEFDKDAILKEIELSEGCPEFCSQGDQSLCPCPDMDSDEYHIVNYY